MGKVVELENTDNYEYVVFNVDEHFRIVTASDVPQWLLQCRDSFGLESSFWGAILLTKLSQPYAQTVCLTLTYPMA